jgi:hypothetical protein
MAAATAERTSTRDERGAVREAFARALRRETQCSRTSPNSSGGSSTTGVPRNDGVRGSIPRVSSTEAQ